MILQPLDVQIIGLGNIQLKPSIGTYRRSGPFVDPFVDFSVSVGEGEASGFIVVAGREVHPLGRTEIGIAGHPDHKETVVDAIHPLVHQHPCLGSTGRHHVTSFQVDGSIPRSAPRVLAAVPANPVAHRHATDPGFHAEFPGLDGAGVGWATKNLRAFSDMLPERASCDIHLIVPAARAAAMHYRGAHPAVPE